MEREYSFYAELAKALDLEMKARHPTAGAHFDNRLHIWDVRHTQLVYSTMDIDNLFPVELGSKMDDAVTTFIDEYYGYHEHYHPLFMLSVNTQSQT